MTTVDPVPVVDLTSNTAKAPDLGQLPKLPTAGVGVIATYDFAADRELWRWVGSDVSLHTTRTPWHDTPMNVAMARMVADSEVIESCTRNIMKVEPEVMVYACTSGSFIDGIEGEANLRKAMTRGGAAKSITTTGALVTALHCLDVGKISMITPYTPDVTDALVEFLEGFGISTTAASNMGLTDRIWQVPYEQTVAMVLESDHSKADAVFISCTNLATFDIISPLEAAIGKPILSANQVTMWAALRQLQRHSAPNDNSLFRRCPTSEY